MNKKDFQRSMVINGRVLDYHCLGMAKVENYQLAYNAYSTYRNGGVLDIEKCNGKQVIGVLYELTSEALMAIDKREGSKYKRIFIDVCIANKMVKAYTYVIKEKVTTKANVEYSGIVYHAMLEHKFPKAYIDDFVKIVRVSIYGSEENYFKYKTEKLKGA